MKLCNHYLLGSLALSFAFVTAGHAQILFSEDFEGWTVGQPVSDSGDSPERWDSDDEFNIIEQDTGNVFGLGTDNQFMRLGNLELGDSGLVSGGQNRIEQRNYAGRVGTGVLSVSFDLYEPNDGNGNGLVSDLGERSFLRIRGDTEGTGLQTIRIDDGDLREDGGGSPDLYDFGEDTLVNFEFVFNQSGADVTYKGNVLSSGAIDVYADGVLVVSGLESGEDNPTDDFARIYFETDYNSGGSSAQELWIDNWQTAAVPEPTTFALLAGFGALGMIVLSRRKRK